MYANLFSSTILVDFFVDLYVQMDRNKISTQKEKIKGSFLLFHVNPFHIKMPPSNIYLFNANNSKWCETCSKQEYEHQNDITGSIFCKIIKNQLTYLSL